MLTSRNPTRTCDAVSPVYVAQHKVQAAQSRNRVGDQVAFKQGRQRPGDILVVPLHNTDISEVDPQIIERRDVVSIPNASWLATWQPTVGAGFYASVIGPLPFAFGKIPPESLYVYELKTPPDKTEK